MKPYVLSCAAGLFVGVIYGVLDVKSPAPPVVALIGLLGMLGGEVIGKRIAALQAPAPSADTAVVRSRSSAEAKTSNTDVP